jgi:hypothetical protein
MAVSNTSCERHPSISVDTQNPPTFVFRGGGNIEFLSVIEIAPENQNVPDVEQDNSKNKVLWWIWPTSSAAGEVRNLSGITYGKVPARFVQKTPANGPPPPLIEGKTYEAGGPPISSRNIYLRFTIREGKVVQIPIPRRQ